MTPAQKRIAEYDGGSLDLIGCDLTGITLPTSIGGWLDLSGCDLTGITLPKIMFGKAGKVIANDGNYLLWKSDDGTFSAGCRVHLSRCEALSHWDRSDERAVLFTAAINANK